MGLQPITELPARCLLSLLHV